MGVGGFLQSVGSAGKGFFTGEWLTGRNSVSDPFGDVQAAEMQAEAQANALSSQENLARESREYFDQQSQLGRQDLRTGGTKAQGMLGKGYADAQRGLAQGRNRLTEAHERALGAGEQGYRGARGDMQPLIGLQGHEAGATGAIGTYDVTGRDSRAQQMLDSGQQLGVDPYSVTGQSSRLEGMLGQGQDLYQQMGQGVDLQSDPGYQFRRQQGEESINRAASATGGRGGGATLKALSEFNQGLASQEFAAADQRRMAQNQQRMGLLGQQQGAAGSVDQMRQQALINQAGRADMYGQQGIQNQMGLSQFADQQNQSAQFNQAGRNDQAALAAQQNQMGMAQMGFGAQGALAGMSMQHGMNQAGQIDQYGQGMAGSYNQQAGYGMQYGSQAANLYADQGANLANIAIGQGANNSQTNAGLMGAYQNYANTGGMVQQAQANSNRNTAMAIGSMFSDRRLKTNLTPERSKYDVIGLQGYRWDWNQKAKSLGLRGGSRGVVAQEVRSMYPAAVMGEDGDWLRVDYEMLDRIVAEVRS